MSQPRRSTDQENAPLLQREGERDEDPNRSRGFFGALMHPTRPLTNLERILSGAAVALLIVSATFIGLYAGAQTTLSRERGRGGKGGGEATVTLTATHTGVFTTTVSPGPAPTGEPSSKVCLTPECVTLSASILASLNTTADPCESFYEYATGGWTSEHSIPADRGVYGSFHVIADNNKRILLKVIESIPAISDLAPSAEEQNQQKLKNVYDSCMNVDAINEKGIDPIVPSFETVLDAIGPFDLVPAPEEDEDEPEYRGAWTEDYVLPAELVAAAQEASGARGIKRLSDSVSKRSFGSPQTPMPLLELQDELKDHSKKEKITKALAYLNSRGVGALLDFSIEGDVAGDDSQLQVLHLNQINGGLPAKAYYKEAAIMDLYHDIVKNILVAIASHTSHRDLKERNFVDDVEDAWALVEDAEEAAGWPWPWPGNDSDHKRPGDRKPPPTPSEPLPDRMDRLAKKVLAFEKELVMAGADPEDLFDPKLAFTKYSTHDVQKALPFFDLAEYFASFALRSFPVDMTVSHPPYLHSVTKIVNETPDYVLSGYFLTRLALAHGSALGPKVTLRKEVRRLKEALAGVKPGSEENRQDLCLTQLDSLVGFIAGREFVQKAFSPEAKADADRVVRSVVKAYRDKLPHLAWMDEESAEAAVKKADATSVRTGYPASPDTMSPESLAMWYRSVRISRDDYFGNVISGDIADVQRDWMRLGRLRDKGAWEMYPQTVNAYASPADVEITFPAGIIQPPFYDLSWPSSLKYGAFGSVASHEIGHLFDNTGAQYDYTGRIRDWWTNTTVKAFQERAQCIARQYDKYYILDADGNKVYVNGNLTNGEDIGDSGIAQSFAAWKAQVSSSKEDLQLPGLDFTPEQLFFLSFGRSWAQLTRPATAVVRIRTDPHSPNEWRVDGTLRNSKEFHEAFGCKTGSRMNPPKEEQCELW